MERYSNVKDGLQNNIKRCDNMRRGGRTKSNMRANTNLRYDINRIQNYHKQQYKREVIKISDNGVYE